MRKKSTTLEISFKDKRLFRRGEVVNGEVILSTAKQLKDISGMQISFYGLSWNVSIWPFEEEEVNQQINLSINGQEQTGLDLATTVEAGIHRFAFSFQLPLKCKSTFISSSLEGTRYYVTAALKRYTRDLFTAICDLTVLDQMHSTAPAPAESNVKRKIPADLGFFSGEKFRSLGPSCCPNGMMRMSVQLDKQVYNPGDVIPISGEFISDSSKPIKIRVALFQNEVRPYLWTGSRLRWKQKQTSPEINPPIIIKPNQKITWDSEQIFQLPSNIPTEKSLFRPFQNRRRLIIMMEHSNANKKERLQIEIPIRIGV